MGGLWPRIPESKTPPCTEHRGHAEGLPEGKGSSRPCGSERWAESADTADFWYLWVPDPKEVAAEERAGMSAL
jgi:hypothetical protein